MIKIIKKGKTPVHIYEVTCTNCKTIFRYDKVDVTYEDRPCGDAYLVCPVCKLHVGHSEANYVRGS